MWGYSGGSMATGFAAELQPSYAPDIDILGAALGGTVPNISNTLPLTNKTPFSGLFPPGVMGLSHEYPEVADSLSSILVPELREAFEKASQQCLIADILQFLDQDMYSYFEDPSDVTKFASILNENSMGQHAPHIPLYIYKGVSDQISAIADTDSLVKLYCDAGSSVMYKRDLLADHGAMAILGAPDALIQLKNWLEGDKHSTSGCSVKNTVSSLTEPQTDEILTETLVSDMLNLLGNPVGPILIG